MENAKSFWEKEEFEKALNFLSAAREHCPAKADQVDAQLVAFAKDIENKFREAKVQSLIAEEERDIARREKALSDSLLVVSENHLKEIQHLSETLSNYNKRDSANLLYTFLSVKADSLYKIGIIDSARYYYSEAISIADNNPFVKANRSFVNNRIIDCDKRILAILERENAIISIDSIVKVGGLNNFQLALNKYSNLEGKGYSKSELSLVLFDLANAINSSISMLSKSDSTAIQERYLLLCIFSLLNEKTKNDSIVISMKKDRIYNRAEHYEMFEKMNLLNVFNFSFTNKRKGLLDFLRKTSLSEIHLSYGMLPISLFDNNNLSATSFREFTLSTRFNVHDIFKKKNAHLWAQAHRRSYLNKKKFAIGFEIGRNRFLNRSEDTFQYVNSQNNIVIFDNVPQVSEQKQMRLSFPITYYFKSIEYFSSNSILMRFSGGLSPTILRELYPNSKTIFIPDSLLLLNNLQDELSPTEVITINKGSAAFGSVRAFLSYDISVWASNPTQKDLSFMYGFKIEAPLLMFPIGNTDKQLKSTYEVPVQNKILAIYLSMGIGF